MKKSSQPSDYQDWRQRASKELSGRDLESLTTLSLEDISVKPVYTSEDLPSLKTSFPGLFPYTRGIKATMYAHRPWTIRQYAGFSSAKATNAFFKANLAQGQTGLSIAFDLPTHRGYDSDDPRVMADVGMAGVAIDSVEDMHILFDGIDLAKVSVSMTMNGAVLPILAAFIVAAEERGIKAEDVSATVQNDILKEFMVRNTFIYPPKPSMRIVADIIEYCAKFLPKFNSISISGYHIHEAGADQALELGLTIADGIEYVNCAKARNISIDAFAPRLSFFFATGMNFFMEIAKLRAARQVWATTMRDLGALDERSLLLRTHCQTSGWSLSAKDPYNNIIRTTIEALASILGGTQSLHTNSFDEALALPTPMSARIARNTQLILQHETKITQVVDPLGGSYYVEYLTEELSKKAKAIINNINNVGGMTKALTLGLPQQWIEEAALKRQALIDSREEVIVGVNKFSLEEETPIDVLKIDNDSVVNEQIESLRRLRREREQEKVLAALAAIARGALGTDNLLELAVNAMRMRATVGEVSLALEKVFGRYAKNMAAFQGVYKTVYKDEKKLRELTAEIELFSTTCGRQPRILMAKLGQDGHDRGAKVIASAFADFGFDVDLAPLFGSPESVARQAVENDVHVIGISSLTGAHNNLVPALLNELKKLGAADILVLVGGVIPKDDAEALKKAGVSEVFLPGTNIVEAAYRVIKLLQTSLSQRGQ